MPEDESSTARLPALRQLANELPPVPGCAAQSRRGPAQALAEQLDVVPAQRPTDVELLLLLTDVQRQLTAARNLAELSQRVIDAMTKFTGARVGALFPEAAGQVAFGGAAKAIRPEMLAAAKAEVDAVLDGTDISRVDRVDSQLAPTKTGSVPRSTLGSCLAVAIRDAAGARVASCFLGSDRYQAFDERDIAVLRHIAGQASAAFQVLARKRAPMIRAVIPGKRDHHFRHLSDTIPQLVWIAVPGQGCVYMNERWQEYTGTPSENALGRKWLEFVHPDDAPSLNERLRELEQTGKLQTEYRLRRRDGCYRWFLVRSTAVRNATGDISQLYGTCTDIEDVKCAQQALLEREAELREAQQLALLGAWSLDFASEALSFSEETFRIFGRDPALGAPNFEDMIACIDLAQREAFVASIASAKVTGHDFEHEWLILRADGAQSWVRGRTRVRRDERGAVAGLFGTLLDITQPKRNERALEEAMRHKDEFLAMLGHELRNPLAAVRNAVELQRLLAIDDNYFVQTRGVIDRQTKHMTRLIDELLDVARLARGKVRLERSVVNLCAVLSTLFEDSANLLEQRGLTLDLDMGTATEAWVDGDATRLTQVLQNLLDNAAKFTDRGGRISLLLDIDAQGHEGLVRVRDSGIGMDQEMLAGIFDPFRQADRSLDRARGGLGLGLALVRGLVELHGGSVSAFSSGIGHGTEIVLHLPLVTADGAAINCVVPPRRGSGLRIVVIEDNVDSADTLRDALQLAGYEVRIAYDGESGLSLVREFMPDLVLCDIGLPGAMTGYDVAHSLRREPPVRAPYLVAVTGYGRSGDREQALTAGFDRHLTKPVNLAQIHEIASDRVAARAIAS